MSRLKGRNALVTGSTQGVGQAIALAVAREGANVVLHGLERTPQAEQTIAACREMGVSCSLVTCDLSDPSEARIGQMMDDVLRENAHIDLLVNNAGTCIDKPFLEMDYATFDKTMKLNVYSYYFLTQRLAQRWVTDNVRGRVLMIGSINGRLAEQVHTAYDTSKGAVEMMVKSMCVSLAPLGIRINGLAPGLFYTPLTAPALDDPDFRRWMEQHTPNQSVPGPETCGDAAVFLLSDGAEHIQGHMLMVDGGMSIWQQPDPALAP